VPCLHWPKVQGWQDNTASIALMKAGKALSAQTKHIHLREFWLKQFMDKLELDMNYTASIGYTVDGLSKPYGGLRLQDLVDRMLGKP